MKEELWTSLELRIIEQFGKILNKFPILHHGWEMDGYGYVVSSGSAKKLIVTDHSKPYEANPEHLRRKIEDYENTIKETKNIIEIIENGTPKI